MLLDGAAIFRESTECRLEREINIHEQERERDINRPRDRDMDSPRDRDMDSPRDRDMDSSRDRDTKREKIDKNKTTTKRCVKSVRGSKISKV